MTPELEEDSPRPAHQELLKEEQERVDHVVDVVLTCYCIVIIEREVITRG